MLQCSNVYCRIVTETVSPEQCVGTSVEVLWLASFKHADCTIYSPYLKWAIQSNAVQEFDSSFKLDGEEDEADRNRIEEAID